MKKRRLYFFCKRSFDIISSLLAIIIFSPVFIIVAILVKCTSKGPVLFIQRRVGRNKRIYNMYKFRTMKVSTPKYTATYLLENPDSYITKFGKFLRKSSLDELPQLLNVLFGSMSLIGPRPVLDNQTDWIEERDKCNANSIRPGLSGLAQINGRNALTVCERAKYDAVYVQKMSMWLDIKIIFLTIIKVLKAAHIEANVEKTKPVVLDAQIEVPEEEKVTL